MRKFALMICAAAALTGCSDPAPVDPPVEPEAPAPVEQPQVAQDAVPEDMAEEVVIEVEPELESAAPMDTGLPMADAASTETEFSGEQGPDPVE